MTRLSAVCRSQHIGMNSFSLSGVIWSSDVPMGGAGSTRNFDASQLPEMGGDGVGTPPFNGPPSEDPNAAQGMIRRGPLTLVPGRVYDSDPLQEFRRDGTVVKPSQEPGVLSNPYRCVAGNVPGNPCWCCPTDSNAALLSAVFIVTSRNHQSVDNSSASVS